MMKERHNRQNRQTLCQRYAPISRIRRQSKIDNARTAKKYSGKNPVLFMNLQDLQESANFLKRRVSA